MKYVTLCHEMIHAFMWSALEDEGLIGFDSSGLPSITFGCEAHVPNPNAISVEDRFVEVICAMQAAGTYNQQWTHELFNKNVFEIEDYRQALEDFLKNEYDWNSESQSFRTEAQNVFGNNWKQEVARAISWRGLEETSGYLPYRNNYDGFQYLYIVNIITKIENGNKNCQ